MRSMFHWLSFVALAGLLLLGQEGCSDTLGSWEPGTEKVAATDASTTGDSVRQKPEQPSDRGKADVHVPYDQTWYGGRVFYQIFPRSFADSNGDGIGDFRGILSRLDYLNTGKSESSSDLKVSGIWLTPIHRSDSYHGYDVIDYKSIAPAYGTVDDFKVLVSEVHKRGMKLILDLVINHSSRSHPWFKESSSGRSSDKRDWYVWKEQEPKWKHPFYTSGNPWHRLGGGFFYGVFTAGMPDLNWRTDKVKREFAQIMKHWIDLGVDGFRLDAIRYLVAEGENNQSDTLSSHRALQELVATARKFNPNVLFVGEAWTTTKKVAQYYGNGDEMDLCFQFDLVDSTERAFQRGRVSGLRQALSLMTTYYKNTNFNAPILGNHDLKRLMSRLGRSQSAAKLAATLLFTLPGSPFVYYGDEIGLGNSSAEGDKSKRSPMQWESSPKAGFTQGIPWTRLAGKQETVSVAIQTKDNDSLLSHYRKIIRIRNNNPALLYGTMRLLELQSTPQGTTLAFLRSYKGNHVLIVMNFSDSATVKPVVQLGDKAAKLTGSTWLELLSNQTSEVKPGERTGEVLLPELKRHGVFLYKF